jgi:hypothetical protein
MMRAGGHAERRELGKWDDDRRISAHARSAGLRIGRRWK